MSEAALEEDKRPSSSFALRCKCANGDIHRITGIEPQTTTIEQLLTIIGRVTNIRSSDNIRIKQGFPPKILDTSKATLKVSSLPIQNGDILIVEEVKPLPCPAAAVSAEEPVSMRSVSGSGGKSDHAPAGPERWGDRVQRGMLLRRIVPADNSCLFSSINFAMNDAAMEEDCVHTMRQLIAATVMSDPATYTAAWLGKANNAYCDWILDPESWGGAIEISILSKHYRVEMCVVDMVSGCIQRFGEDQGLVTRIYLIYDGIHYDPLMLEPFVPGTPIQTRFSTDDHAVMQQALDIGEEGKASAQFTDTARFTLRCTECGQRLTGELGAQQHALTTGHTSFGEQ